MLKKELRQKYRSLRRQFTMPEMHVLLAQMLEHFNQIDLPAIQYVFSFRSIADKQEVPVYLFEEQLMDEISGIKICYPRTNFSNYNMEAVEDADDLDWQQTAAGIEEPQNGRIVSPELLDLVFVPLVAFDAQGYRVGYGKGFYDRYLARCKPGVIKIGFSFFEAEDRIDDTDAFDVPLNYCVTPQRTYVF